MSPGFDGPMYLYIVSVNIRNFANNDFVCVV